MNLKQETRRILESGADSTHVLDLVRLSKAAGTTQREAYDELQELWLEYGFDDKSADPTPIQNHLEYAMEVVWGFCPANAAIWDTSLSNQNQPS